MSGSVGLSVVIPVYNGALSIGTLVDALRALPVAAEMEIILVNDASPDDSLAVCRELAEGSTVPVTVVDLARNFGEHNAVMAGLSQARGDYVITMDDDMQNPPADVGRLYGHARAGDYDVVYTHAATRAQHDLWRRMGSRFANWCADQLIDKPAGLYLSSFRCMSAFAVKNILPYRGPHPYIDGLLMQVTQRIGQIEVVHLPRAAGRSNYTIRRLVRLWLSILLNFSVMPLRLATLFGLISAGLGIVVPLATTVTGQGAGWKSLISVLLLVSGVQLFSLGVLGEFLGRLFLAANGKPQYIIRSVMRCEPPGGEGGQAL